MLHINLEISKVYLFFIFILEAKNLQKNNIDKIKKRKEHFKLCRLLDTYGGVVVAADFSLYLLVVVVVCLFVV